MAPDHLTYTVSPPEASLAGLRRVTVTNAYAPNSRPGVWLTDDQFKRFQNWRNLDIHVRDALPDLSTTEINRLLGQ